MNIKTFAVILAIIVVLGGGYHMYSMQIPAGEGNAQAESPAAQGKLDINVVCESVLAYMTFPDGESAAQFVAECKAGERPEVIERYKADMGYTDDRAI